MIKVLFYNHNYKESYVKIQKEDIQIFDMF